MRRNNVSTNRVSDFEEKPKPNPVLEYIKRAGFGPKINKV